MASVVYFSRPGENIYRNGRAFLNVGNTEVLAREIAKQTKAMLFPVFPVVGYSNSYDETLIRSSAELEESAMEYRGVRLSGRLPTDDELGGEIYLGFPVWWNTLPVVIAAFLKSVNLAGKVVHPFCTHEGSRFGKALADIATLQPLAVIAEGLPVRGSCATCSAQAVSHWLECSQTGIQQKF